MVNLGRSEEPAWVLELRTFLREQKDIQAIKISPESHTVSVATFSKKTPAELETPLQELLVSLEDQLDKRAKTGTRLAMDGLWVRSGKNETVVEKTQCPAVRSLWTWRQYEWPSADTVVEESEEEWKFMALLAGICGT